MKKRFFSFLFTTLFCLSHFLSAVYGESVEKNIIESILKSSVQIEVFDKSGDKKGSGSGFIVDSKGIIVTNNHVMNNAYSILITLATGEKFKDVKILDFDEVKDIAIIKISGFDLPTVKLGNSNSVQVGIKIFVCGNSLGDYQNSLSDGIISGIRQNDQGYKYLQMTAPISPGNSGGPVFTEKGEVIGISTASRTGGQNINFAVPINYAIGMLDNDKDLTLEKYSGLCGQQMEHIVQKQPEANLAHPDSDISKRIVIVPFSGFCDFDPNIGLKIGEAIILRLKEKFSSESLFIPDLMTVKETLKATSGDSYDAILTSFNSQKAKDFAIKFRANTVIFGSVEHFEFKLFQGVLPGGGIIQNQQAIINVNYSVYKLDKDTLILSEKIRRKQNQTTPEDAILRVGSIIVGKIKDKYKTFAGSNLNGEKAIKIEIQGSNAIVVFK